MGNLNGSNFNLVKLEEQRIGSALYYFVNLYHRSVGGQLRFISTAVKTIDKSVAKDIFNKDESFFESNVLEERVI